MDSGSKKSSAWHAGVSNAAGRFATELKRRGDEHQKEMVGRLYPGQLHGSEVERQELIKWLKEEFGAYE